MLDRDRGSANFTEYRVSVYGIAKSEWTELATWIADNNLSSPNNCWLVQCPRVFNVFKKINKVKVFQDLLTNVFEPLFEATLYPEREENVHLSAFLANMSGFDSVDDESKEERNLEGCPEPAQFGLEGSGADPVMDNPPYAYWGYYMAANIYVLNKLR